ncbi:MAG: hypothetical protein AMXMBFR58_10170 [Phycisphaerae bacterium]|nr:class I SAM-dependent methyltransferase [Phycisphaerales bacterium]
MRAEAASPESGHTPRGLADVARRVFTHGPLLTRTLQHYRPYICPFEELLRFVPEGSRVLDIGCGGGLFGALVCATRRPARFVGFDSSRAAIDVARAGADALRAGARSADDASPAAVPEFLRLDVGAPWPDGPFDVVSIIDVVHHIPPEHQRAALQQAAAVLEPGGTFIYKDMTRRGIVRPLMNRVHDLALARQWIHYADLDRVQQWLTDAGLAVVHRAFLPRWWYGHELLVLRKGPAT